MSETVMVSSAPILGGSGVEPWDFGINFDRGELIKIQIKGDLNLREELNTVLGFNNIIYQYV